MYLDWLTCKKSLLGGHSKAHHTVMELLCFVNCLFVVVVLAIIFCFSVVVVLMVDIPWVLSQSKLWNWIMQ